MSLLQKNARWAAIPPHVISSPIFIIFTAAIMPEVRFFKDKRD